MQKVLIDSKEVFDAMKDPMKGAELETQIMGEIIKINGPDVEYVFEGGMDEYCDDETESEDESESMTVDLLAIELRAPEQQANIIENSNEPILNLSEPQEEIQEPPMQVLLVKRDKSHFHLGFTTHKLMLRIKLFFKDGCYHIDATYKMCTMLPLKNILLIA